MRVSIVVAVSRNGVIGADGGIPWRLPDDQKFFKRLTMGHCILMGRGTWDSIGRPLPGRTTIVISRNPDLALDGAVVVQGLDEALAAARAHGEDEAFVVGGASIYEAALPRAERVYLTRVDADVAGDVRFPDFPRDVPGRWRRVSEKPHAPDERHVHAFTIERWDRVAGD